MNYDLVKWLHWVGITLLLLSLGSAVILNFRPEQNFAKTKLRVVLMALHGSSLVVILVSGLALLYLTRVQTPLPLWVYLKVFSWVSFGVLMTFIRKNAQKPVVSLLTVWLLAILTISIVIWKPALILN